MSSLSSATPSCLCSKRRTARTTTAYFRRLCREGLLRRYGENPPDGDAATGWNTSSPSSAAWAMSTTTSSSSISSTTPRARASRSGRGAAPARAALRPTASASPASTPCSYNLLFERFLNPERVSMPDFDVDFCYERRPGGHRLCRPQIRRRPCGPDRHLRHHGWPGAPSGTSAGRWACPIPRWMPSPSWCPMELHMTLDKALEVSTASCGPCAEATPRSQELIDTARKVEGMPRHASTHAAGVVITRETVDSYVPLAKNDECHRHPVHHDHTGGAGPAEDGLSRPAQPHRHHRRREDGPPHASRTSPWTTSPTTTRRSTRCCPRGVPTGVFQLESGGMRRVLIAAAARSPSRTSSPSSRLYRPGPMDSIPTLCATTATTRSTVTLPDTRSSGPSWT